MVASRSRGLPADTREEKSYFYGTALAGVVPGFFCLGDFGFVTEDIFRKIQNRTREEILN